MNWYREITHKVESKGLIKTANADSLNILLKENVCCPISSHQHATDLTIYDIQRYAFDSYAVKTSISQTQNKLSVAIRTNHAFLGTINWNYYWYYDLDQEKEAVATYKKLNKLVLEVVNKFVDEEIPTSMFWVYLKKMTSSIDLDAEAETNIPHINYYRKYDRKDISPDWRSNIYGNRYPKHVEKSYRQKHNLDID